MAGNVCQWCGGRLEAGRRGLCPSSTSGDVRWCLGGEPMAESPEPNKGPWQLLDMLSEEEIDKKLQAARAKLRQRTKEDLKEGVPEDAYVLLATFAEAVIDLSWELGLNPKDVETLMLHFIRNKAASPENQERPDAVAEPEAKVN